MQRNEMWCKHTLLGIYLINLISLSFCSQMFKWNGCKYKPHNIIKTKYASHNEHPTILATCFVSIVIYLNWTIML
jgi:hypothetical protein